MTNPKILIVEDELIISEMLKEIIQDCGCEVVAQARDFSEALIELVKNKIDIAFLDVNIGEGKNGVHLAEHIKIKYGIPFVFVTSYGDRESIMKAIATNPEAYLTKPFKFSDVYATIQMILNKQRMTQSIQFKEGAEQIQVHIDKVLFLKSDNIYVEVHTTEKKHIIRATLEGFLEDNHCEELVQVHRSYVVNTKNISAFESQSLIINEYEIPVSRKYKPMIKILQNSL